MSARNWQQLLSHKMQKHPAVGPFLIKYGSLLKKAGVILIIVIVAAFLLVSNHEEVVKTDESSLTSQETTAACIYVDVGGEVSSPGVFQLDAGCRVADAISAAGGLTSEADISAVNQAAPVNDGEKIYIPAQKTENESADETLDAMNYANGKVNINLADSEELQSLTGVGPVTAEKIIEYRNTNGRFSKIEDIKNVSGIGDKTFEKLKEDITI